jgi:SAM-dependent methyltransferase
VPLDGKFADLRPLFPGRKYVGADMRMGPGVDVVLDLHRIDLPDNTVGTVLTLETFEHVRDVQQAMKELKRILKKDGTIIISSLMNFPIHEHPSDYWRFTPEAFKSLLDGFGSIIVESVGDQRFPHTVVGIGTNEQLSEHVKKQFLLALSLWKKSYSNPFKGGGIKYVLFQMCPPAILYYIRKIRHAKR